MSQGDALVPPSLGTSERLKKPSSSLLLPAALGPFWPERPSSDEPPAGAADREEAIDEADGDELCDDL